MDIVNFPREYKQVGARGVCPHCSNTSCFKPVTPAHVEEDPIGPWRRICNAAQCEACKEFVLVLGLQPAGPPHAYDLDVVYPIGKPDDRVDPSVPQTIAPDFKEALRCRWIAAFRATVAMCRRALQASAIALGAKGDRLVDQIDDLAQKGIITEPLRNMAHEVRLTGNIGAHPDKDGLEDVTERDADDIIEFTREYLHHVYVMPSKLEARRQRQKSDDTSHPA